MQQKIEKKKMFFSSVKCISIDNDDIDWYQWIW